ncbi:MAG TPA: M1 family metallopeptidase [Xanthomonadales bacterium]|nr:M1 family metallopeptidase [Xanthomonadales bacterium]
MRHALVTAIALVLAGPGTAVCAAKQDAPAAAPAVKDATTQLPRTVRPTHYDLAVAPDAQGLRFAGHVAITLDVLQPTKSIVLNAVDMTFANTNLAGAGHEALVPNVWTDADTQTATFTFERPLAPGRYTLTTDYTGKIGTQANGLFAIDYDTKAGKKRALYTQFENSDARKFVPSWDEPNFKATFSLAATVPSGQMAVSNMPAAKTVELGNGTKRVEFAPSPKMSTYLLFFALGDFDRATARAGDTEVGVVTQAGAVDQAKFALDSSVAVLAEYNDYFGIAYPLPKLDNVASPGTSQFFGAMENWGAIFTFEHALLLDPSISTQYDKQRVFAIAAHEIAHQWFGDLVTMSWWDDLWLNEGFATWMSGRTTAKLHPEWNTKIEAVEGREYAMARDAVVTTHPVVQHVETVEQASQAFDAITYQKGAAVIRMLEGFVGEDAWRKGVRSYMQAHRYGNTVSDDLWREVQAAAGKPVLDIAHDFTLQPGVPLMRVASATCKDGVTTARLVQGEFTKDRPDKVPLKWRVPVIATAGGEAVRAVVAGEATLAVPGCGTLIANAGQSGYYRTLYAQAQFEAIRDGFAGLAPIDQLGLMGDTWALGMAGTRPASDFLDLARATPPTADATIWGNIAGYFGTLDDFYRGDAKRQAKLRRFASATLTPALARIGWDAKAGEPDPVAILRNDLIETLGALGDANVVAEARRRWAARASDAAALPAATRKSIQRVVAYNADAATWDELHAAAQAEKTPLVKDEYYALLSSTNDAKLAQRALDLALTDEPGETNSASIISKVSIRHPELAFHFAVAHREQVNRKVDTTSLAQYYPYLVTNSLDPKSIDELKAFADRHIAASSRQATETAIANIRYRTMVRRERLPAIDAWLARHG